MKLSKIKIERSRTTTLGQFTNEIKIESQTDLIHHLQNAKQVNFYIAKHGDVETVYDSIAKVYRVPAFAENIEAYNKMKQEYCNRHGSN